MTIQQKREWIAGIAAVAFVVAVLAGIMVLSGCAARVKNVTDLPPDVTLVQAQQWDTAVANLHKIAVSTSTLRKIAIDLNKQGVLPDGPAYSSILTAIAKVDRLQLADEGFLRQAPHNFGAPVKAQIAADSQTIADLMTPLIASGTLDVKDTATKTQLTQLFSEIAAAAQLSISLTK
jgi:hypothetical protein